jgi:hypothetical protein
MGLWVNYLEEIPFQFDILSLAVNMKVYCLPKSRRRMINGSSGKMGEFFVISFAPSYT